MTNTKYEYDVAFSFLADDEALATSIADELRERMKVFIYSERQKELVGKDGLEEFSSLFRENARICVVLYRDGWGQTKWIRIEETAIKERALEDGWEFLIVIALDSSKLPPWLPKTKIWFEIERYGARAAAAAIDARVQEAGGEPREESPQETAARLASAAKMRAEREQFLGSVEGVRASEGELAAMFEYLEQEAISIKSVPDSPQITFQKAGKTRCIVSTPTASFTMGWTQQYSNTLKYSVLLIQEFDGPVSFRGYQVQSQASREFRAYFVVDDTGNPAWRDKETPDRFYTSQEFASLYLKRLLKRALDASETDRWWERVLD